jgi:Putative prokaryotic signal transducing protein
MSSSTSHRSPSSKQRDSGSGGGGGEGGDGGGDGNGGHLVKVGFGRTQVEAEMLQGFLGEAGIPSVLKRTIGFDTPEFFASGPHDVFVNASDAKRAREVLAEMTVEDEDSGQRELEEERRLARGETGDIPPARLAFWLVAVALGGCLLAWLLYQAT